MNQRLFVVRCRHVDERTAVAQPDRRLRFDFTRIPSHEHFVERAECSAFPASAGFHACQVVNAEDHILRRNRDGLAAGGGKQVLRREHQNRRFDLSFR
jgi:hypothetical protein